MSLQPTAISILLRREYAKDNKNAAEVYQLRPKNHIAHGLVHTPSGSIVKGKAKELELLHVNLTSSQGKLKKLLTGARWIHVTLHLHHTILDSP